MQTMAAKSGLSMVTTYGYLYDDRQMHSGPFLVPRDYDRATPAKRGPKQEENSLPEYRKARGNYLSVKVTPRGGNRYVARVFAHPVAGGRIKAQPHIEQPKPQPPPLPFSPEQIARRLEHIKAMIAQLQHLRFLMRASTGVDAAITAETARIASKAWDQVWEASGRKMPVPSAATNVNGKVFYSWDNGQYHLDMDIVPNEPASVFFCDREKNEYWCEDYRIGSVLPAAVVAKLSLFA